MHSISIGVLTFCTAISTLKNKSKEPGFKSICCHFETHPTLPESFGRNPKSCWSFLSGIYARGSKISYWEKWKKRVVDSMRLTESVISISKLTITSQFSCDQLFTTFFIKIRQVNWRSVSARRPEEKQSITLGQRNDNA